MPLSITLLGKLSSALAGEVALGSTGAKGAFPCAQAEVGAHAKVVEASSAAIRHAFRILFLPRSKEIVGVCPALALAWLERDGDIRLQAVSGVDRPHVDLGNGLVGA